ncbi:STAS domain-containing protein [Saccharothrix syringae]|uniref:STAS domain-containing protein n=1 Tax=Saccharothrix syringae TaxID=103733 RepID=UPI00068C9A55|nr:STAS domain-containing protein [Saccharothrix syringae]
MEDRSDGGEPAALRVDRRVVDGTTVVAIAGEIDLDGEPTVRTALTDAIDESTGDACVVDLVAVTFLGSAGLTALLQAARHAHERHRSLRIVVDANRPVIRPIEITGLDDVLRLYHSVDEALHSHARP